MQNDTFYLPTILFSLIQIRLPRYYSYIIIEDVAGVGRRRKKERKPRLSATLRYRVLFGDSFESQIFFLQLLLAVTLGQRPA
jgi:hypothetical protein